MPLDFRDCQVNKELLITLTVMLGAAVSGYSLIAASQRYLEPVKIEPAVTFVNQESLGEWMLRSFLGERNG